MVDSFISFILGIRIPYELVCFLFGILCGFVIYRKFGPECKRLKLEEEKQRYQRREAEAKRRLDAFKERKYKEAKRAFYKECAERGIVYSDEHGAYLSTDKTLFCPACYRVDKLSELVFNTESEILYCTECGEKIERKQNRSSYFYR